MIILIAIEWNASQDQTFILKKGGVMVGNKRQAQSYRVECNAICSQMLTLSFSMWNTSAWIRSQQLYVSTLQFSLESAEALCRRASQRCPEWDLPQQPPNDNWWKLVYLYPLPFSGHNYEERVPMLTARVALQDSASDTRRANLVKISFYCLPSFHYLPSHSPTSDYLG